MAPTDQIITYLPFQQIFVIVGNYGSGKTEIAINLACYFSAQGKTVQLADLDLVNPYFRTREHYDLLSRKGIQVMIPPGELRSADLPIVIPEIQGMFSPAGPDAVSIFDVGGDEVGARVLATFRDFLIDQPHRLLQVINTRRPFTRTVSGCLKMKTAIENVTGLQVNGLIANSHLCDATTVEIILEGYRVVKALSEQTGIPIEFVGVMEALLAEMRDVRFEHHSVHWPLEDPVLVLKALNLPPWRQTSGVFKEGRDKCLVSR